MANRIRSVSAILLCALMVTGLAGCGKKDVTWEEAYNYNIDDCVKLGEYKGIEVEVPERNATAEDVQAKIDDILEAYASFTRKDDWEAQVGDKIVIDYVGTVGGKEFEGGTGSGTSIIIGAGGYIDGFEDSLVGHKAGDEFDMELTFPDSYMRTSLAGRDVTFAVTVKEVYKHTVPDFDDGFAIANSNFASAEEYRQSIIDEINSTKPQQVEDQKMADCWQKAMDNFLVFYVPQDDMQNYYYSNYYYYFAMAKQQNIEFEDFLMQYLGMDENDFDSMINKMALAQEEEVVIAMAIAREEGYTITNQMYKDQMEAFAVDWGYESASDFKKQTGQALDEYYSPKMIYREIFLNLARQCVLDNSVEIAK